MGAGFADAKGARRESDDAHPRAAWPRVASTPRNSASPPISALIVKLLQAHMTANAGYSESLARANVDLPQLNTPDEIRAVVLTLIEENRKIQTKMDELSASLDESVNKIEKLRSNLAEANDKAMRDSLTGLGNRRFFDEELELSLKDDDGAVPADVRPRSLQGDQRQVRPRGRRHGAQAIRRHPQRGGAARRFRRAARRRGIRHRHVRRFAGRGGAARRADPPPARGEEMDARQRHARSAP